tara:strand:- start:1319 stop:1498 length:180 start_codon:yes stop_codon:yes gene_type:complete
MDLQERFALLTKRPKSCYQAGSIYRIFEIYEREGKDYQGNPIVCINPTSEEKKIKRSIN